MKKIFLVIVLIFLLSNAFSAGIQKNSINIIVDKEGTSLIEENYYVSFEEKELELFKESISNGLNQEILQSFSLEIEPKLENTQAIISFEEPGENKIIKLNYFSNGLFSVKNKITFNEVSLNTAKFSFLFSGQKAVFPENFSLRFVLPREAKNISVSPETNILSNTLEWKGLLITETLELSYEIPKEPEQIKIRKINIKINVNENGFAEISEKYFFDFRNNEELEYFVETAKKNGSSLLSWNAFDKRIFPHIGVDEFDTKNATVEFIEKGLTDSYLNISYENKSPLFIEEKERSGRFVEWKFNSKKLNSLISRGVIILPENMSIEIILPSNAEIKESSIETQNGKIVWEGYKTISQIKIVYIMKENIAPAFNLSLMIQNLLSNKESIAFLIAVIAVIGILLSIKKKSITAKIDEFIINNSKIEEREEIDLDN